MMLLGSKEHELVKELRDIPDVLTLFKFRTALNEEIQSRAWDILKLLGYDWYKQTSMQVAYTLRGKVTIVTINATFERNHQTESANHEMPLDLFNKMVARGPQAAEGV